MHDYHINRSMKMAARGLSRCFRHLTASRRQCLKRMIWQRCMSTSADDSSDRCDVVISGGGMVGTAMACALGEYFLPNPNY